MKQGWRTHAIGRHLVDVPAEAIVVEAYKYNDVEIELLPKITTKAGFDYMVSQREKELRAAKHVKYGSLFVEMVSHANGSVTLISWNRPTGNVLYIFDTYFRAGSKSLKYSGEVSPDLKVSALSTCQDLSGEWREIPQGELPEGVGFVAGDTILVDKDFNRESWELNIQLPDRPDVSFRLTAYAQTSIGPGLRVRAGGILPALLGTVAGVGQLRNRARPVGPIEADEILVAGTQDGKRTYGFKWEAPGKAYSLAEPNLNASLRVGESAYLTNKESFANDGEALELWDGVVDSIRLRPGAV
ncbi:T6SS immunity protein Tli4 family protein [Burkholderia cenocepacia]|uniref:T6SS immunity protein Tli4 family protein n=1 Tax=Burkholderia cenocepacia TaxID=95486 RepID=UPI0024B6D647|nr:T6SS immunity protein Tli4 family protein [Burkholderia cenocepacia]MDI9649991.1 T6SS immunity protein Tli4 family protein [Burkholderia cenocepacia]MDI9695263.1 T6SS immunity protein Tli4 family protein [Burkholderia cenocepacia]